MTAELRIGTAGWSIPRACADRFPGEGPHLERYARRMNAAEINTSFYRPHRRSTWERWAAATPPDFRFSVKTPRLLTHDQRLADPEAGLDAFAAEVAGLGDRLGAVLVQLPPNLPFEAEVAGRFFDALSHRLSVPIACEPRHADWFTAEAEALLVDRRVARVAADPAKVAAAAQPGGWRGFAYVRLHGSPRVYYSAYDPAFLAEQAARLRTLAEAGPAWCVLDNTAGSAALGDALTVRSSLTRETDQRSLPRPGKRPSLGVHPWEGTMTETTMTTPARSTPWHLWAVGVISLLWNGFGAYDFVMSMTQREAYWRASGMTDAMITYYNAMPTWMYVPWVLGVWGAVAGSVLLLMRSRFAVHAFILSLVGAVVSLLYGTVIAKAPAPPPEMAAMAYMPYVIVVIAALLAWYAWTMRKKGVLA